MEVGGALSSILQRSPKLRSLVRQLTMGIRVDEQPDTELGQILK